jgi:hypothetical protein
MPRTLRRGSSAPPSRSELVIDKRRLVGDLISYQNDGKGRTVIVGKAERS